MPGKSKSQMNVREKSDSCLRQIYVSRALKIANTHYLVDLLYKERQRCIVRVSTDGLRCSAGPNKKNIPKYISRTYEKKQEEQDNNLANDNTAV